MKKLVSIFGLAGIYYVAGRWGLAFDALNHYAAPVWIPTGISLAALCLFGIELWPGIALGAFCVNWNHGTSFPLASAIAIGNTLEAVVGFSLLRRLRFRNSLDRLQDFIELAVLAAGLSTLVSATIGTLALSFREALPLSFYQETWIVWWTGDMLSNLVVAPLVLAWGHGGLPERPSWQQGIEAILLAVLIGGTNYIVFAHSYQPQFGVLPLPYMIIPGILWAALRFGTRGAVTSTFLTAGVAILSTSHGLGPFAIRTLHENLMFLETFVGVLALASLSFASIVCERTHSRKLLTENERKLRQANDELENRVLERTQDLFKMNAQLRDSEEHFRMLVEGVEDYAIFGLDPEGRVVTWNSGAQRIKGYTSEEILGQHFSRFYPPKDVEAGKPQRLLNEAIRKGKVRDEGWRIRKDGVQFFCDVVITAVKDKTGALKGFTKITRDITQQKRYESTLQLKEAELFQAQKLEAIGRLAGGVAHDFNNLITGILGISQDLQRTFQPEDPRLDEIDELIKASNRAFDVTRQLLTFGRRQIAHPKVVDVNATIRDFGKLLHRLIGEDVKLELRLSEDSHIRMDPGHLGQLLLNLTLNARDAMPNGGIILIQTSNIDRAPSAKGEKVPMVLLEVTDTGKGMDPEVLAHLFEPFYTTKTKGQGTGLGLATVYGIVKQSGGDISVNSQPANGTTFRIWLPREIHNEAWRDEKPRISPPASGHETVLVVEDEDIVRRVVVKKLRNAGYQVLEANDPHQVLSGNQEFADTIDLVVTDVVMPGMNGREFVTRLHKIRPDIAVLYMSGYPENIIAHRGILDPGINFIEKSAIQEDLVQKVREILDNTVPARA